MSEDRIKQIADNSNMIVRGYAFTKEGELVRVFNLNDGISAMVITLDGTMVETNMDEIEQVIVKNIWKQDAKYMEV